MFDEIRFCEDAGYCICGNDCRAGLPISPDCRDKNCPKCDGTAWDLEADQETRCSCPHHDPPEPRQCDKCGRFAKTLTLIYVGGPAYEPDCAVGECCLQPTDRTRP